MQAKSRTNKHVSRRPQAQSPLGQVSADIVEYSSEAFGTVTDMHGCKYAVVFIDGYSRYSYVVPIRRKSDALWAFKRFVQDVGKPRELLTDCDSVFLGAPFSTYCTEHSIRQVDSIPHRQHFNGLVERGNKELKTIAKALLLDSGLPTSMWAYALCTASYLKNRTSGIHGKTPYQLCTPVSRGSPPSVSHLRVWGSPCFAYVENDLLDC